MKDEVNFTSVNGRNLEKNDGVRFTEVNGKPLRRNIMDDDYGLGDSESDRKLRAIADMMNAKNDSGSWKPYTDNEREENFAPFFAYKNKKVRENRDISESWIDRSIRKHIVEAVEKIKRNDIIRTKK